MALVPAVLCVPLWISSRGKPRLALCVAAIPPILSWSYYVAMPYTGEIGLLGLGTAAWFVVACGAYPLDRGLRQSRPDLGWRQARFCARQLVPSDWHARAAGGTPGGRPPRTAILLRNVNRLCDRAAGSFGPRKP